MLFTLMQVIGVQAMIRDVPEARIDQRGVLVIAFVQQTMYRHGKLIVQLFVGVGGVCSAWCFGMKKAFVIPKTFVFTMVETRGIEPLTS